MSEIGTTVGWPDWLDTTDHIGSHYPYYRASDLSEFSLKIPDIIESIPASERQLDISGVVETLSCRYPLGNRTLVSGVRRAPWLAKPTKSGWQYHPVPEHGHRTKTTQNVSAELHSRLQQEISGYIEDGERIGILLSGGLDSRIVAGLVRELQLEGKTGEVVGLTWGIDNCRDVEYARRIATEYGWEFRHFELTPDILERNIRIAGLQGAEFAPYHLHALPDIRKQQNIDILLAGSYGNSICRAEYSGTHVSELGRTAPYRLNKYGLHPHNVVSNNRETVWGDGYGYRSRIDRQNVYQYREIEQQMHYMRRELQACMTYVADEIPLYQLFTSPAVVEFMWSLDPKIRSKEHATALLRQLPGELTAIPEAKSGVPVEVGGNYGSSELAKHHHNYATWMRGPLREHILSLIRDSPLIDTIFNRAAIERVLRIWPRAETITTNAIDEVVSWLASLSIFVKTYDIELPNTDMTMLVDSLNAIIGPGRALSYQTGRELLRE